MHWLHPESKAKSEGQSAICMHMRSLSMNYPTMQAYPFSYGQTQLQIIILKVILACLDTFTVFEGQRLSLSRKTSLLTFWTDAAAASRLLFYLGGHKFLNIHKRCRIVLRQCSLANALVHYLPFTLASLSLPMKCWQGPKVEPWWAYLVSHHYPDSGWTAPAVTKLWRSIFQLDQTSITDVSPIFFLFSFVLSIIRGGASWH